MAFIDVIFTDNSLSDQLTCVYIADSEEYCAITNSVNIHIVNFKKLLTLDVYCMLSFG